MSRECRFGYESRADEGSGDELFTRGLARLIAVIKSLTFTLLSIAIIVTAPEAQIDRRLAQQGQRVDFKLSD